MSADTQSEKANFKVFDSQRLQFVGALKLTVPEAKKRCFIYFSNREECGLSTDQCNLRIVRGTPTCRRHGPTILPIQGETLLPIDG